MLTKYIDAKIEYAEANKQLCENGMCNFVKTAADRPDEIFDGIKIKKNHAYLYVIAMGAGDYYGENKNGDFFWERDLIQYHKKFLNAGVFIQHDNKDPNKSIGKVLKADYNHKMHRVELLIEINRDLAPQIYDAIANGERIAVSMGVKVPSESCSYCGKVTEGSIANRCEHLKFNMHQIMPDGTKVFAINHPPLNFFDISVVRKPADHQGYALFQKVASLEEGNQSYNVKDKIAGLKKIAELTKRIDALATYNPMSFKMVSELRSTPKDLLKNYLRQNDILLHPAEYIAIFKPNISESDYHLMLDNFDRDSIFNFFQEVIKRGQGKPKVKIIKIAAHENEAMKYMKYRDLLAKEAATLEEVNESDAFGRKQLRHKKSETEPGFPYSKFALIKAKLSNGDILAYRPSKFVDIISDALEAGVVDEVYGVMPNGAEAILYSKDK